MSSTGYCPPWPCVALQHIKANECWGSRGEGMWLLQRASSVLQSLSSDTNDTANKQICARRDAAAAPSGCNVSPRVETHVEHGSTEARVIRCGLCRCGAPACTAAGQLCLHFLAAATLKGLQSWPPRRPSAQCNDLYGGDCNVML